ncbi:type VI secretion system protein TssL, short form [Rahnella woolbedingensis]|uniref:DotU family type IV/VI secretion system protein n=1 Tax=Rahnella woolbedingensis TaxID=1510574 RepID=A0A419NAX6_9GAMM|nr:type VI secretion system protein TssL, short form [Rahnella woolbedingensis]RJT45055.1 DotU family type IV/VI secretion system protein [Rahnella woolbedingensis]
MSKINTSVIDEVFYPCWLMVSQLRNGQEIDNGEALYHRACEWIESARESLTRAGFSEASCDHMLYTQCALLDESVLNRQKQDSGYTKWIKDPLQARYFNTLNAGEELWERIRKVLQEPAPDVAVLTCFYRALTLGFLGRYREQGDERREDVVRKLNQLVPPFASAQEMPIVSRSLRLRSGRKTYWFSWVAGIVLLIALWFVLNTQLTHMVSQLTGNH